MDYKSAGVDVEAGYKSVELIKDAVKSTYRPEVCSDLGGFGGLFSIEKAKTMEEPVLVSGTDGVGTKLKLAFLADKHDTIGIDAVAMCVNDVICCGAEPLFFLDYIACGKNVPNKISEIVSGVAVGCRMAGCSLVGGETAEMPGFYPVDEYDLAGFAVGLLDKKKAVGTVSPQDGDTLIGIASNGVHSNGFSLVRKALDITKELMDTHYEELNSTLGEELLKPTRIYVLPVLDLISKLEVRGLSHITGGGFIENIPRMLPEGLKAVINEGTWPVLPIFDLIEKAAKAERMSMYNTFNMGIGMVVCVASDYAQEAVKILEANGERAYIIGSVSTGEGAEICLK